MYMLPQCIYRLFVRGLGVCVCLDGVFMPRLVECQMLRSLHCQCRIHDARSVQPADGDFAAFQRTSGGVFASELSDS